MNIKSFIVGVLLLSVGALPAVYGAKSSSGRRLRQLSSTELGKANKLTVHAEKLRNEFKKNYRTLHPRHHQKATPQRELAFEQVVQAYNTLISKYPLTEIGANTTIRLAGFYKYSRNYDKAIKIVEKGGSDFAGTPMENEFFFSAGLMCLQSKHDPLAAAVQFKKIPKPSQKTAIDERDYNENETKYLSAQQTIAKCELQVGQYTRARHRCQRLAMRMPFYRSHILKQFEREAKIALDNKKITDTKAAKAEELAAIDKELQMEEKWAKKEAAVRLADIRKASSKTAADPANKNKKSLKKE
jgi:hypothetical protein